MPWAELRSYLKENRETTAMERREPPVSCPIDGSLLTIRADGVRNCPMGNYRWPR